MHRNIQKRVGGQKPEFGNCLESTYNVILHKYTTTHRPRRTHTHITGHSHLQLFYSIRVIFNNKLYYTENFLSFQPNIRSFTIACVCARFLVVYIWNLYWLLLFGDNYYSYHTCVISIETECVSEGDSKRQCEWKLLTKRYTINDWTTYIRPTKQHQPNVVWVKSPKRCWCRTPIAFTITIYPNYCCANGLAIVFFHCLLVRQ